MKNGTDAEKIVIYLTPFVLKMNLKIIIYEFDSIEAVCVNKTFPCYLENNQSEIVVLYRKTHYDLVYTSDYFEKHTKHLSSFVNLDENLRILNYSLLEKLRSKSIDIDEYISDVQNPNNTGML